jgi:ABC-type multidrug transport system fused ATPase/permease subunit
MKFDNAAFETNVAQTMSTLDKLKAALKFDGASKGIADIEQTAKRMDLSPAGAAVDALSARFVAMSTIAITALSNITSKVIDVGIQMGKSLSVDQISSGFSEYETNINSVQTILANTKAKGSTIDDVNEALDKLNKYSDQTIYNFSEMARNIGTFTAAGVGLDQSVNAIKGIANLAAISGSNSQLGHLGSSLFL